MKVKELVDRLRAFDSNIHVICYCEEEGVAAPGHGFRLFDIAGADVHQAETTRGEDGVPSLKFGKTEHSVAHVLIEITSDF